MPSYTKALLAYLNVYIAENNVRRSAASFALNIQNADAAVKTISTTVLAGNGNYNFVPDPGNVATIVYTSIPLDANVSLDAGGGFSGQIQSLMFLDLEVAGIVFVNSDVDTNAQLTIISM